MEILVNCNKFNCEEKFDLHVLLRPINSHFEKHRNNKTRMHSSNMRTSHFSGCFLHTLGLGEECLNLGSVPLDRRGGGAVVCMSASRSRRVTVGLGVCLWVEMVTASSLFLSLSTVCVIVINQTCQF